MLALLKHSYSEDYLSNITTLLTDLGATQSEVSLNSIYSNATEAAGLSLTGVTALWSLSKTHLS